MYQLLIKMEMEINYEKDKDAFSLWHMLRTHILVKNHKVINLTSLSITASTVELIQ